MEPATKERIIRHMNTDHQLALVDYAVVYGKQRLTSLRPETVVISDIDTNSVKLRFEQANGTIKVLDIVWKDAIERESVTVEEASDIKPKLIAMAKYAAKKQGFSHKQIKKALPPKSALSYFMYTFAALLTTTLIKPNFVSGFLFGGKVGNSRLLSKWLFVERNIVKIFATTYGIHLAEIIFVMIPKIRYYRMPMETALTWSFYNFIEGFLAFLRLNEVVRSEE